MIAAAADARSPTYVFPSAVYRVADLVRGGETCLLVSDSRRYFSVPWAT